MIFTSKIGRGTGRVNDWREILHEEVARLSEKYRLPVLLCDLQGKTQAQAAHELKLGRGDRPRADWPAPAICYVPASRAVVCSDHSRTGRHLGPVD